MRWGGRSAAPRWTVMSPRRGLGLGEEETKYSKWFISLGLCWLGNPACMHCPRGALVQTVLFLQSGRCWDLSSWFWFPKAPWRQGCHLNSPQSPQITARYRVAATSVERVEGCAKCVAMCGGPGWVLVETGQSRGHWFLLSLKKDYICLPRFIEV